MYANSLDVVLWYNTGLVYMRPRKKGERNNVRPGQRMLGFQLHTPMSNCGQVMSLSDSPFPCLKWD